MSAVIGRLRHPIIAAPMGGGPSTPELVAAVGEAGGLGFLAAGYRSAAQTMEQVAAVRRLTGAPFGVNVFVPRRDPVSDEALDAYRRRLAPAAARLGTSVGEGRWDDDDYPAKIAALTESAGPAGPAVAVVSFAFELPGAEAVEALHAAGSEVWITLTRPDRAEAAERLGADALVLQGAEAGAHRGGADDTDDYGVLPLLRLVARRTGLPLVASGGIGDGPGVAAALAAGAAAVSLGTAFLRCPEAATSPPHRAAVAAPGDTRLTRAFTGRRARGIVNGFLAEHDADAPVGYPQVHHMTVPLRAAARSAGDAGGLNLWAGQAHELAEEAPAGTIVARLAAGAARAADELSARLRRPSGQR